MKIVATLGALLVFGLLITALTASVLEQAARRQVEQAHAPEVALRPVPR